jgi:hypothetical protein
LQIPWIGIAVFVIALTGTENGVIGTLRSKALSQIKEIADPVSAK